MVSVWAIYEVRSFPWRVFLCFIWNPPTHTSVHSMVPQKVLPCHLWEILLLHSWALSHRNVWCLEGGGQVTLLSPGLPAFLGFSLGQRGEVLLRYFLPVLSWAIPKKQEKKSRRQGDDPAVVSKGITLAVAEDTPSLTGRWGEILAGVKGKTLWVWDFIQVM